MSGKKRLLIWLAVIFVIISMVPGMIKLYELKKKAALIFKENIKPDEQKEVVFTVTEAGYLHIVQAHGSKRRVTITLIGPGGEVLEFHRTKPWWWGWHVEHIEFIPQENGDYTVKVDSESYGVTIEVFIREKISQ